MQTLSAEPAAKTRATDLVRIAAAACSALLVCFPLFFAPRPRTPLRVFCIIAFDYLARLSGSPLQHRRRIAIARACDFGSLRDKYYDERMLDRAEYRSLRLALRQIAAERPTREYIHSLRHWERSRPALAPGCANATSAYRRAVIELSLRWMEKTAGTPVDSPRFDSIVNLVCLMQLADDLLDWREDIAQRCPSYVTALLVEPPSAGFAESLRAEAKALLIGVIDPAKRDVASLPFALAGVATWALAVALIATHTRR